MAIKDMLLTLTTYPEPTPARVIEDAVALAATLDAHLAAIACETHVEVPGSFIASSVVNVPALVAEESRRSLANASELLAMVETTARKQGVSYETITESCLSSELPDLLAEYARLRDLTITSVQPDHDPWEIEAIIFESGRPTLLIPPWPRTKPLELKTIVVAWDFSRAAARAVADSLPLLQQASKVHIVTVMDEKVIDTKHSAEEVAKNLARHGIDPVLDEVILDDRDIGEALEAHALSCGADMLVMGAYGHSRFREFILGGATISLLTRAPLPILFSH